MKSFLMRLIGGFVLLTLTILFTHPYVWALLIPILFGALEVAVDTFASRVKRTQAEYFGIWLSTAGLVMVYQIIFFTINAFSEGAWWGYVFAIVLTLAIYQNYFKWEKPVKAPEPDECVKMLYVIHPGWKRSEFQEIHSPWIGHHDFYVSGVLGDIPFKCWTYFEDYIGNFEHRVHSGAFGTIGIIHLYAEFEA